jgi:hypothetical protein
LVRLRTVVQRDNTDRHASPEHPGDCRGPAPARLVSVEHEQRAIEKTGDPRTVRALGLCVSIGHARFMTEQFRSVGIPAVAIWGDSPMEEHPP